MSEVKYNKQALLAELKKVMDKSAPENNEIDITISDIEENFGITYATARGFLNNMAKAGVLRKIKLPSREVIFRDVDGHGVERATEYIKLHLE